MEKQKDLKEVVEPAAEGQVEKNEEAKAEEPKEEIKKPQEVQEESIEALKERLKKAEEERENLSKAVTRLNKERKLPSETKEEEEEVYPEWDDTSKKFQEQTTSQARKVAEQEARKILESSNEKAAIDKFTEDNPDVDWDDVISYYNPKSGKETVKGILKDLKHALVLSRYEKGELTKSEAEEQGKAKLADMSTVSKTTSKTTKGKPSLSSSALAWAERLRVDPEKLAEEDDSNTAVIKY